MSSASWQLTHVLRLARGTVVAIFSQHVVPVKLDRIKLNILNIASSVLSYDQVQPHVAGGSEAFVWPDMASISGGSAGGGRT